MGECIFKDLSAKGDDGDDKDGSGKYWQVLKESNFHLLIAISNTLLRVFDMINYDADCDQIYGEYYKTYCNYHGCWTNLPK